MQYAQDLALKLNDVILLSAFDSRCKCILNGFKVSAMAVLPFSFCERPQTNLELLRRRNLTYRWKRRCFVVEVVAVVYGLSHIVVTPAMRSLSLQLPCLPSLPFEASVPESLP